MAWCVQQMTRLYCIVVYCAKKIGASESSIHWLVEIMENILANTTKWPYVICQIFLHPPLASLTLDAYFLPHVFTGLEITQLLYSHP